MRFGLIAEDERDCNAYTELIGKIRSDIQGTVPVPCHGVGNLKKIFVGYLKYFEYSEPVDKVLVIRDSDCADAVQREQELQRIFAASHFQPTFPFHFYATKCELETWLLADENAINLVAQSRGKTGKVKAVKINFENHRQAKELFEEILSQVQLPADPAVYREIAPAADIKVIASKCPRFALFANAVRGC